MGSPIRRRIAAAGCVAVATTVLSIAGAATASANEIDEWFPTIGQCQTEGNILAQQGQLWHYTCTPSNGGYVLNGS